MELSKIKKILDYIIYICLLFFPFSSPYLYTGLPVSYNVPILAVAFSILRFWFYPLAIIIYFIISKIEIRAESKKISWIKKTFLFLKKSSNGLILLLTINIEFIYLFLILPFAFLNPDRTSTIIVAGIMYTYAAVVIFLFVKALIELIKNLRKKREELFLFLIALAVSLIPLTIHSDTIGEYMSYKKEWEAEQAFEKALRESLNKEKNRQDEIDRNLMKDISEELENSGYSFKYDATWWEEDTDFRKVKYSEYFNAYYITIDCKYFNKNINIFSEGRIKIIVDKLLAAGFIPENKTWKNDISGADELLSFINCEDKILYRLITSIQEDEICLVQIDNGLFYEYEEEIIKKVEIFCRIKKGL